MGRQWLERELEDYKVVSKRETLSHICDEILLVSLLDSPTSGHRSLVIGGASVVGSGQEEGSCWPRPVWGCRGAYSYDRFRRDRVPNQNDVGRPEIPPFPRKLAARAAQAELESSKPCPVTAPDHLAS